VINALGAPQLLHTRGAHAVLSRVLGKAQEASSGTATVHGRQGKATRKAQRQNGCTAPLHITKDSNEH
jgi:hypothetical protein